MLFIYWIYFWLCCVFIAAWTFSSCGKRGLLSSCIGWTSQCSGFSSCGAWTLEHVGFSSCSSRALEHRLHCPEASRIFLDQGLNPCRLHWQMDSLPLSHQGSPIFSFLVKVKVAQSCPTLCDPMDSMEFSRPEYWRGSPSLLQEIFQTRGSNPVQFSCSVMFDFCDPIDCSTPGLAVHHQSPEPTQTHVHHVSDAIQPSHPLSFSSPCAFNLSQHQGLSRWVGSLHQVAKVLEQP